MRMRCHRVITSMAMPLVVAFLAAAPATAQNGPAVTDHVPALAGTWTCRSVDQETIHETGSGSGASVTVRSGVQPAHGNSSTRESRYEFKPALGRWSVAFAPGTALAISGDAAPWTGDRWVVDGRGKDGELARIVFELVPGGDLRRSYFYGPDPRTDELSARLVERCSPGDAAPLTAAPLV